MPITTLSSREFNQDTGRAKKAADDGPVFITDRGRPAHVLLTIEEYRRLTGGKASVVEMLRDAVEGERRRLASVRDYALTSTCRQAHAVAYLGDSDTSPCGICDICRGQPPLDESRLPRHDWRRDFDPRAVLQMASEVGPDDVAIARALCQVTTTRSRPYRKSRAWGSLERAPYGEVLALVRETLAGARTR